MGCCTPLDGSAQQVKCSPHDQTVAQYSNKNQPVFTHANHISSMCDPQSTISLLIAAETDRLYLLQASPCPAGMNASNKCLRRSASG